MDVCDAWVFGPPDCARCHAAVVRAPVVSAAGEVRRTGDEPGDPLRWRPTWPRGVAPGEMVGVLYCAEDRALWPEPAVGWWPRPRRVEGGAASAEWRVVRCVGCGGYRASLHAARAAIRGGEITVPEDSHVLGNDEDHDAFLLTFDGGARAVERLPGARAAGVGAILWGPADAAGRRRRVAQTIVALPEVPYAQEAEAAGCGAALDLLLQVGRHATRRVVVSGDNLAVVRYAAGVGRLRREAMFARLDGRLGSLLSRGWHMAWRAVRRRLNVAVDGLATSGVRWAAALARAGRVGQWAQSWWAAGGR